MLANAEARSYALNYANPLDRTPLPPLCSNEAKRLEVIEKHKLWQLGSIEELDIICDLIAKRMDCQFGFVTITSEKEMLVIGSSMPDYRLLVVPREKTMCTHLVPANMPLIVPSLQADIRFYDAGVSKLTGADFYCGCPLVLEDDVVVGVVSCVAQKNRQVTQSQYNAMGRLARTASRVVQTRSKRIALRQLRRRNHFPFPLNRIAIDQQYTWVYRT